MKKELRKEFESETPELILIVTDKKRASNLEKIFQKGLDQLEKQYVALSLCVAPKDLRNMLTAIRLMDVTGLFLTGAHQKKGRMFADTLKTKLPINAVVLRNKRYSGYYITPNRVKTAPELAETVSGCIRLWTRKSIDTKKLSRQIKGLRG